VVENNIHDHVEAASMGSRRAFADLLGAEADQRQENLNPIAVIAVRLSGGFKPG
jgi:hypothetical protein